MSFLGLTDPGVIFAYVLSIASALLCVVYGVLNWNKE
ncbi:MAG: symporter small accessory protein [Desulfitobacteriaceae bacterium]